MGISTVLWWCLHHEWTTAGAQTCSFKYGHANTFAGCMQGYLADPLAAAVSLQLDICDASPVAAELAAAETTLDAAAVAHADAAAAAAAAAVPPADGPTPAKVLRHTSMLLWCWSTFYWVVIGSASMSCLLVEGASAFRPLRNLAT